MGDTNVQRAVDKNTRNKWRALELASPSLFRPHGLSGIMSVVIGTYITSRTLLGYYTEEIQQDALLICTYIVSGVVTCLGALGILKKAPVSTRTAFFNASVIQIALLYVCWRFATWSPHSPQIMRWSDAFASMAILYVIGETMYRVVCKRPGMHWSVRISILCGLFALSLLSGYPLQLALQGDDWFNGVLTIYPLQRLAFVYYVYIPATFGFHVIVFAATLDNRKIIGPMTFAGIIFVFVFGILVPTVLLQEVYIGCVSTQKLLISGDADQQERVMYGLIPTSWIDTSIPAQRFWMYLADFLERRSEHLFAGLVDVKLDPATQFRFYECYTQNH